MTAAGERWLIQLPISAADLPAALRLARLVARSVSFLPTVDTVGTTVSAEACRDVRHRAFCDRRTRTGRSCLLRDGHDGPCSRRLRR